MSVSTEVDLSQTPITALRERTRRYIEHALNEKMVLPTDDDLELSRDWQGLVSLINLDHRISHQSLNPTKDALNLWKEEALQKEQKVPSLKELQSIFCQLDRWDIFYDTEEMILNDAIFYKKSLQLEPSAPSKHLQHGCLTSYDINRYLEGKELLDYDAFVLYAEEDAEFARVLKDKLEQVYRLSVVCKEDLITAGFELQALTNLITRCSALIVIMSPTLFKTENNKYLLGFAEAVSVEQRKSRIIPCRYQPCTIPRENSTLQYLVCHDYVRLTNLQIDFFKKVSQSVQAAGLASGMCVRRLAPIQSLPEVERCKITEVKSEEEVSLAPEKPVSMETAIVCLSDASTHFPGNTLENSLDNKWDVCSQNVSDTDSKFEVMKKTDKSTSFLSKKKKWFKEKKKNWWKKERAVALVT